MRIRLEKRLTPSRFMQIATPVASVLLTMLLGAIIFQLIGFDGPHAIYETFITPIVSPCLTSGTPIMLRKPRASEMRRIMSGCSGLCASTK